MGVHRTVEATWGSCFSNAIALLQTVLLPGWSQ